MEVEVEVEVEVAVDSTNEIPEQVVVGPENTAEGKEKTVNCREMEAIDNEFIMDLEEDPDMYAAAGLPIPETPVAEKKQDLQTTIQKVVSSLPNMQGANVTLKVLVISGDNHGTINF